MRCKSKKKTKNSNYSSQSWYILHCSLSNSEALAT